MGKLLFLIIQAALINNLFLSRFIGTSLIVKPSRSYIRLLETGLGMTVIISAASIVSWFLEVLILGPFHVEFLRVVVYMIAVTVIIERLTPWLKAQDVNVPLLTTNSAVLGVTLLMAENEFLLIQNIIYSVGAGLGLTVVMVITAALQERLSETNPPKFLKGLPLLFITIGFMSLAFSVFSTF